MHHFSHQLTWRTLALSAAGLLSVAALAPSAAAATTPTPPATGWTTVALGTYHFGHQTSPGSVVATAGAREVGFVFGNQAASQDPSSFQVTADGSVWLLDTVNARALVWAAGQPAHPSRTVPMPSAGLEDFAVATDGTVYATAIVNGPLHLFAYAPDGHLRWQSAIADQVLGRQLRLGTDGVLYRGSAGLTWTPLTTPTGTALTTTQQAAGTHAWQVVAGGQRLTATLVSAHEYRFALSTATGAWQHGWRLTSTTPMQGLVDPPTLIGGDLVVVLHMGAPADHPTRSEYQVVRVSAGGSILAHFSLDGRAAWGEVTTFARVGPDGALYTLRTDPATGASVGRYVLATGTAVTPSTGATSGQTPTDTPTVTSPTLTAPAVTTPSPSPTGESPSDHRAVWWTLGASFAAVAFGGGGWLWYRRTHL